MGQASSDIAFDLGRRLRDQRYRAGLTQAEAAATARTSASTISRMELGHGETVPLGVWLDVADAVGSDLFAWRRGPESIHLDAIARLALDGEWALAGRRGDVGWFDRPAHPIRYLRPSSARRSAWSCGSSRPRPISR